MLLAALVLIAVDGEHDGLEQRVDLRHADEPAEMCNVSWLRLQQEKEISITLGPVVVGEDALLDVGRIVQVARHLVLLRGGDGRSVEHAGAGAMDPSEGGGGGGGGGGERGPPTSSRAMRFWMSRAMRESR